jgi:hypothetical protein
MTPMQVGEQRRGIWDIVRIPPERQLSRAVGA